MTIEWIRFYITAACMIIALMGLIFSVIGVWHFDYILNRMHSGGITDTFSLFFLVLGLMISASAPIVILKLMLPLLFMWFSSPTSSHFLSQTEYYTNKNLFDHIRKINDSKSGDNDGN
ncbi:MAG: monovalent cation/H(+) antiporter subunit G [Lachnospiraceae bacterium]|nr:monovalent cation/H(+) antiporter subunit G [Lachnospiraceae bacterium]MDN4742945.1 monovalent cation/H(+) antiporter subunit G [Lachnospiraceae bacterium C1.1]